MIQTISGDLLDIKDGIICHQVNYLGIMGGGVAAAIREKLLTEEQYQSYVDYARQAGRTAMGTVQFIGCGDLIVANMFCQDDAIARGDMKSAPITSYEALARCLVRVRTMARLQGKRVYMPYHLGCGIAGGDWGVVEHVIKSVFDGYPEEAYIVKRQQERSQEYDRAEM